MYTDQPFLPVGTGCVINNRIWNEDFYSDLPVGQIQPDVSNYDQDERFALPPGFKSDHMCHPEWFATGEPWPNLLPDTEYSDGMPLCCGFIVDAPRGGVIVGGSAGDVYRVTTSTSGGVSVGGSAGDVFTPPVPMNDPTEGGAEFGGESGTLFGFTDPTEGGAEFGGEAGDVAHTPDPTEGGAEFGGQAGDDYGPPVHGEIIYDSAGDFTFTAETSAPHTVECWGPGGRGIGMNVLGEIQNSGGGGGAYASRVVTLAAFTGYAVVVESGGSELPTTFEDGTFGLEVKAAPGRNATNEFGAQGGQTIDCVGSTLFKGGNGGDGGNYPGGGGGGGGGAGSTQDGLDGQNPTGLTGGAGGVGGVLSGGDGGFGGDDGFNGFNGNAAGGGGGGGGGGITTGGAGLQGRVRITW